MTASNGSGETARWSRRGAPILLWILAAATSAHAQVGAVSYPRSRAIADVAAWVASDTPISPAQVVDIGPSAVTAVTSSSPTGSPRGFLANIAAEALDPSISRQEEIASWTIPIEVDCEKRVVRLGDMTGFSARDLKTAPRVVRPADTAWVTPSANAPLGAVLRALCDREFQRPLANVKLTKNDAKPARAAPPGPPPVIVNQKPPTKPRPLTAAAVANGAPEPKAEPLQPEAASPPAATANPARKVAHGSSPFAVQVAASPNADEAKAALGRLEKKLPDALRGFKTEVQTAEVGGKTVYRAVVSGFAGVSDANALCDQFKAANQACFVRR